MNKHFTQLVAMDGTWCAQETTLELSIFISETIANQTTDQLTYLAKWRWMGLGVPKKSL